MRGSSQQGLQHAFDRFSAACNQAGTKTALKGLRRYYVSPNAVFPGRCPRECFLQVSEKNTAAGGDVQVPWNGIHE